MYQRVGNAAYKSNLDNTLKLAEYLNHPEEQFKSIHVGGTNGKGSTSHMLASILFEAGYKVGLYTSPHLKDFRERIRINGIPIPKRTVSSFVSKHRSFFENNQLSFFEMSVGLAFDYFRKEKVDIALIEVGLGGRLDSTNIVTPEISIITNIGLDHTQFLGTTLEQIAFEKAGIIKKNIPVIIGESLAITKPVFQKEAKLKEAPIYFAEDSTVPSYDTDLVGWYQKKNKKNVLVAIEILNGKGFVISTNAIRKGLLHVVKNTGLQGRWQVLQENPKVICDTAHNTEGLTIVLEQLIKEPFDNLHVVLGVVNEKDLSSILPLFPKGGCYYFCKPDIPRGMNASDLKNAAEEFGLHGDVYSSVNQAYRSALTAALKRDLIFVGGSTFVVAEVL